METGEGGAGCQGEVGGGRRRESEAIRYHPFNSTALLTYRKAYFVS